MEAMKLLPSFPSRDQLLDSFRIFNAGGGKFRLAVVNVCNLDCFFCHNEAMENPRRGPVRPDELTDDDLVGIANAWASLGGDQINITGGEPLAHPSLASLLSRIDKRSTRIALNTNAILADRLLSRPKLDAIDLILASLHSVDDEFFRERLGGKSARKVMDNIVALSTHGYKVEINFSLSGANREGLDAVLDFALENGIDLKAIALVRSSCDPNFYGGDWVDPKWISERLEARGAKTTGSKEAFGGRKTIYKVGSTKIEVKNIATGRLETDFCRGCLVKPQCGEGIYGLRMGVDAVIKPCLLRRDRYRPLVRGVPWDEQILETIHAMVGDWSRARFVSGAPA